MRLTERVASALRSAGAGGSGAAGGARDLAGRAAPAIAVVYTALALGGAVWFWLPTAPDERLTVNAVLDIRERAGAMRHAMELTRDALDRRPLFHPSRRPPAAPAPAAPEKPTLDARLIGVVGEDRALVAILSFRPAGRVRRVRTGDRIRQWVVAEIDDASVRLVGDDGEETVLALGRQP